MLSWGYAVNLLVCVSYRKWLNLIHIQVEEIARQLEIASAHAAQPTNDKEFDVPVPFQRG